MTTADIPFGYESNFSDGDPDSLLLTANLVMVTAVLVTYRCSMIAKWQSVDAVDRVSLGAIQTAENILRTNHSRGWHRGVRH